DGIRDWSVTGVQTCALPISSPADRSPCPVPDEPRRAETDNQRDEDQPHPHDEAAVELRRVDRHGSFVHAAGRVRRPPEEPQIKEIGRASCRGRGEEWGGGGG